MYGHSETDTDFVRFATADSHVTSTRVYVIHSTVAYTAAYRDYEFERACALAEGNRTAAWFTPLALVQRALLVEHAARPARAATNNRDWRARRGRRLRDYRRLEVVPRVVKQAA